MKPKRQNEKTQMKNENEENPKTKNENANEKAKTQMAQGPSDSFLTAAPQSIV